MNFCTEMEKMSYQLVGLVGSEVETKMQISRNKLTFVHVAEQFTAGWRLLGLKQRYICSLPPQPPAAASQSDCPDLHWSVFIYYNADCRGEEGSRERVSGEG